MKNKNLRFRWLFHRLPTPIKGRRIVIIIGNLFFRYENKLLDALKTRNYSFLAHGLNPIGKENFDTVFKCISSFIDQGIEAISFDCKGIKQLPRKELL